jgi:hypothetical protein
MPRKRAQHKRIVAAWITETTKEELKKIAKQQGITVSDVIIKMLEQGLKNGTHKASSNQGPQRKSSGPKKHQD